MSNVTPPGPAGAERLTVKTKLVVPALPSFRETSFTVRLGRPPPHGARAVALLRGLAAAAAKSAELLSVSVQPPAARKTAFAVLGAGVFAPPSLQLAVVP